MTKTKWSTLFSISITCLACYLVSVLVLEHWPQRCLICKCNPSNTHSTFSFTVLWNNFLISKRSAGHGCLHPKNYTENVRSCNSQNQLAKKNKSIALSHSKGSTRRGQSLLREITAAMKYLFHVSFAAILLPYQICLVCKNCKVGITSLFRPREKFVSFLARQKGSRKTVVMLGSDHLQENFHVKIKLKWNEIGPELMTHTLSPLLSTPSSTPPPPQPPYFFQVFWLVSQQRKRKGSLDSEKITNDRKERIESIPHKEIQA